MTEAEGQFRYRLAFRAEPDLPPLAWLALVDSVRGVVSVVAGTSVRAWDDGFFEGTWAGAAEPSAIASSTTVFGSGIVAGADGTTTVVTPSHTMSGVFARSANGITVLSNSLTAILAVTGASLVRDGRYPSRFIQTIEGVGNSPIELPSDTGTLDFHFWWNLALERDGSLRPVRKPDEAPFLSFADYRGRLSAALASVFTNAPGYEPAISLSSGYDSTTVAVLAAENGCCRVLTFAEGRRTRKSGPGLGDSGEANAKRLGMEAQAFDRLAYMRRMDLPEAEFMATGMSGEDVIMSAYEPSLGRGLLLTGNQGNGIWRLGGSTRTDLRRSGLDGASLHEFRLRRDFAFVPLPTFGLTQRPSVMAISASHEMKPWSVGGRYDQPISRRIAEEAGLPRGSFAARKHAVAALIHTDGEDALAPATRDAIRQFARANGEGLRFPERFKVTRWHRALIKVAPRVGAEGLVSGMEESRRALVHFEPAVGTLLLRWGVSVIKPRYASLRKSDS
jgi:hypothetical protein